MRKTYKTEAFAELKKYELKRQTQQAAAAAALDPLSCVTARA